MSAEREPTVVRLTASFVKHQTESIYDWTEGDGCGTGERGFLVIVAGLAVVAAKACVKMALPLGAEPYQMRDIFLDHFEHRFNENLKGATGTPGAGSSGDAVFNSPPPPPPTGTSGRRTAPEIIDELEASK